MEVFYSNNINGERIILSPEESLHCVRVLRHREGDMVKVSGGDGNLYLCQIAIADPKEAELRIISVEGGFGSHNYFLHIAVAPTKNIDRFEWFLEKATEIGIDQVTPLLCDHSERKTLKPERAEKIILAAAKQSLKGYIPVLHSLTPVREFIAQSAGFEGIKCIAFCDHELVNSEGTAIPRIHISEVISGDSTLMENAATPKTHTSKAKQGNSPLMVLIGPEGDFSREEIRCAADAGFIPISLGESRLRTETAALLVCAAVALAHPR